MRSALIMALLVVLAGCAERQAGTAADAGEASRAAAAAEADPHIVMACPEATNYAPPDWPFQPGDMMKSWDLHLLRQNPRYDHLLGTAVVWVVGESGLPGAIPFAAAFAAVDETGQALSREANSRRMYVGHLPALGGAEDYELAKTGVVPEALRGFVLKGAAVPGYDSWRAWDRIRDRVQSVRGAAGVVAGMGKVYVRPRDLAAAAARYSGTPALANVVTRVGVGPQTLEEVKAARALWYGEDGLSW